MEIVVIDDAVRIPLAELEFRFARSGGPGGQNVNKVSSRVELRFNVKNSPSLTADQRRTLISRLRTKIDTKGVLHLVSQESRSQWKNRERVLEKFIALMRLALRPEQKRIPTKPSSQASAKRVEEKKMHAAKKRLRQSVRGVEE